MSTWFDMDKAGIPKEGTPGVEYYWDVTVRQLYVTRELMDAAMGEDGAEEYWDLSEVRDKKVFRMQVFEVEDLTQGGSAATDCDCDCDFMDYEFEHCVVIVSDGFKEWFPLVEYDWEDGEEEEK